MELVFKGIFKENLYKYIEYKQALGYSYDYKYAQILRQMNYFFEENYNCTKVILTKEMVLDFIKKRDNEANSTIASKCSIVREFATFLKHLGYTDIYILPNSYIPRRTTSFIPYIFPKEQIVTIFDIIDNYNFSSTYLNERKIYSTLVRLLYGCGLRISEALSLKVSNFDFANSIIHILEAKNKSSRIVCMSSSLSLIIQNYIQDNKFSKGDLIFPSPSGYIYTHAAVYKFFKKFFSKANIVTAFGKLPRIHDLRHTFAVHSLEKMIDDGMDIYCMLPFLSSFLGHKNIYSTEKYLRLVEDNHFQLLISNNILGGELND